MTAVHILIFGEMAGFKIVPFIATHMKMNFFFSWSYQNSLIIYNCAFVIMNMSIKTELFNGSDL